MIYFPLKLARSLVGVLIRVDVGFNLSSKPILGGELDHCKLKVQDPRLELSSSELLTEVTNSMMGYDT